MKLPSPLITGTLIRRYKRFLADVELDNGNVVTAHCANTGSMSQVSTPGSRVMISRAINPVRKTLYDWQLTMVNGSWAGINTAIPNILLKEGFERGYFPEFKSYDTIRTEVKYGSSSRVDALLSGPTGLMYVEAKNVTLVENSCALFPDAVTSRGTKHLDELIRVTKEGHKAAMFFLSQRMDAHCIGIASHIDHVYAERLQSAALAGVIIISWRAKITPEEITLDCSVPFIF